MHRHSGSKKVDILIQLEGGEVLVTVRDYGRGIASQKLQDVQNGRAGGVGLTGLRECIAALGGLLQVLPADPGTRHLAIVGGVHCRHDVAAGVEASFAFDISL